MKTVITWFQPPPFSIFFHWPIGKIPCINSDSPPSKLSKLRNQDSSNIMYAPEPLVVMPHCYNKIDHFWESAMLYLSWLTMLYLFVFTLRYIASILLQKYFQKQLNLIYNLLSATIRISQLGCLSRNLQLREVSQAFIHLYN